MSENQMSRTAEMAAIARAVHQQLPAEARIYNDLIAPKMVDLQGTAAQALMGMLDQVPPNMRPRLTNFVLRGRFAEDCLEAAVRRGVQQYVIVGAGLDTFAYRQPAWASGLRIFEVDSPSAQAAKRRRLAAAGVPEPSNLSFVPLQLGRSSLLTLLEESGFEPSNPTFVSVLGVSQYLPKETLEAFLREISTLPAGSSVVLTAVVPENRMPPDEAYMTSVFAQQSAQFGEPWLTRLDPEAFVKELKSMGFSETEHLSPEEANDRYFRDRTDLRAPSMEQMIRAGV